MDIKYKNSRIAVVVPRQSFVYRGVGIYCKSIIDFALANNIAVDIISDDHPRNNGLFESFNGQVNWIVPEKFYDDPIYKELSTFSKPYNTAAVLNMRNGMIRALKYHCYDAVITNTTEALDAVTSLGLQSVTKVAHATHHESEANVPISSDIFSRGISDKLGNMCGIDGVILLAQSKWVKDKLVARWPNKTKDIWLATPLLTEPALEDFNALLDIPESEIKGVGFIGPYEPRKGPEEFIRAVKEANLPAVVITPSEVSAKKFRQKLEDAGVEHEVHVGLVGNKKIQVLRRLAVAYHPALSETFGLAAYETAHCCYTIVPLEREWAMVHGAYANTVAKKDVVSELKAGYACPRQVNQKVLKRTHADAKKVIFDLATSVKENKPSKSNFYDALDDKKILGHAEFVGELKSFCVDEILKLSRLPYVKDLEVLHTKDNTYYRWKGCQIEPESTVDALNLFSFE